VLTVDLPASSRCFLDFFFVRRRFFCSDRFLSDFAFSSPLLIDLLLVIPLFNDDLFATSATMSAKDRIQCQDKFLSVTDKMPLLLFTFSTWPKWFSVWVWECETWQAKRLLPSSLQSMQELGASAKASIKQRYFVNAAHSDAAGGFPPYLDVRIFVNRCLTTLPRLGVITPLPFTK
jgi:hypothetical protein